MALRAFQANPSIGGFGGESQFGNPLASSRPGAGDRVLNAAGGGTARSFSQADADRATSDGGRLGPAGGCDAFAQIVKELVDNAVDACAATAAWSNASDDGGGGGGGEAMKRVRVTMTAVSVPVRRTNGDDGDDSVAGRKTMDCLRVEVSDNGCGMEDIDRCVSAFSSNKNGATTTNNCDAGGLNAGDGSGRPAGQANAKKKKGGKKQKSSQEKKADSGGSGENYTSGRYGVGLTLCLLHAQRLVPGTGACITSATATACEWTRATYEPDTGADNIVCKKKETFPKKEGECGTTISLLVPGGEEAKRAWPRLAEYFARFQLSIDLNCSLEVKAPTLQSMPLYIRPPSEMERRANRRRNVSLEVDSSVDGSEANSGGEGETSKGDWEGGDGFDDGQSIDADRDPQQPKLTKAAQQRAEAELQKKKKISLICRASSAYKRRPDLKVENVAYTSQPIRRNSGPGRSASKDGPVLEVGLVVFGPPPDAGNDDDDGSDDENVQSRNRNSQDNDKSLARLQVVRMVNGIPLLDSSEALACGVVQKISNNNTTWNSFGLNVTQKSDDDIDPIPLNERNTPAFEISDSAQVAPFLKSTTHALFRDQSQDSSDEEDFDVENMRGKRKQERQVKCVLPAALRLGDMLMIVQIRAKPSALPLPTLSKGRLPLNDKDINDALENGISDCLRCLQRSNPGLLLTAHQLKKVERDVKYIPLVADAMASVLCRSKKEMVHNNAMNTASHWDEEVRKMGVSCLGKDFEPRRRRGRVRANGAEQGNDPIKSQDEEEMLRVDSLRPMLERRLGFIVSDEFKDAKKAEERENAKKEREEIAAAKKRAKKKKTVECDSMKSDCFESDDDGGSQHSSLAESPRDGNLLRSRPHRDFDSDSGSSRSIANIRRNRKGSSIRSRERPGKASSRGDDLSMDDSPVARVSRQKECSIGSSEHLNVEDFRSGRKKPACDDFDSVISSPNVRAGGHHWKHDAFTDCSDHSSVERPRKDKPSTLQKSACDDPDSDMESPVETRRRADNPADDFDDGYESSSRCEQPGDSSNNALAIGRRRPCKEFQSDKKRRSLHSQSKAAYDDAMSSDSDWSSQFGEVVPGHFFRV